MSYYYIPSTPVNGVLLGVFPIPRYVTLSFDRADHDSLDKIALHEGIDQHNRKSHNDGNRQPHGRGRHILSRIAHIHALLRHLR